MRVTTAFQRGATAVQRFLGARRGNVSILFCLSLVPMLGLAGLGVDYGVAFAAKSKLDNAADAAALAAVATAKAYVAANPSDTSATTNAIAAGLDRAKRAFSVNAGTVTLASLPTPTISLTRTGPTFASAVSYTTRTTTQFGTIFGQSALNVAGSTGARADVPSYLDFYLLVDVSGSMGLPSTAAGQAQLKGINHDNQSNTPEGCQFACHFPGYTGYNLAVQNNIQLRSGAVNYAVCQLLKSAAAPQVQGQYRVGIYPFINQLATLVAVTASIDTVSKVSDCSSTSPLEFTSLLDTGSTQLGSGNNPSTGTGSGGTHFETSIPNLQSLISPYGDGSSAAKSRPYVFLITDGMQNSQHYASNSSSPYYYPGNPSKYSGYGNANFDGSSPQAVNPALCSALKSAGATISVLYIPYTPFVYQSDPWGENAKANAAVPNLPSALQQCASSGFFYTANSPTDITNALNAMFNQAIQVAHLVQ